ncbi:MAG TPA: vitamin K epoxide reductase family protein [Pyrinomonadaceae bacterium]|nr:vitamin K epoxide reductase family protein [Pyrinomonadaceae bacterium]
METSLKETEPPATAKRTVTLYGIAALVALIGLADSLYLTIEHISGRSVRCTIVRGCSEVLSSPYASWRGIPLALIGAAAYFTVFSLATLAAFGYKAVGKILAVVVGLMFLTSLWLVYLQAFVIKAYCQFCLLSALVTLVLTVLVVTANRSARPKSRVQSPTSG